EESAIGEPAPAERRVAPLLDDVDGNRDLPVELVALEISDDMRHEPGEMLGAVAIRDDDGETFRVTRIGRAVFVWQVHEPRPRILADSRLMPFSHPGCRRNGGLHGAKRTGRGAYGSPATFRISMSFRSRQRCRSAMLRPAASSATPSMIVF